MKKISIDYSNALSFISENEITILSPFIKSAHEMLHKKTGPGNDFTGWVDLPKAYDRAEFDRIKAAAEKIQSDSDALVVIGIGGSYLGARAAIEAFAFVYNLCPGEERHTGNILRREQHQFDIYGRTYGVT